MLEVVEDRSLKNAVFDISFEVMLEYDVYVSPKVVDSGEFEDMRGISFLEGIGAEAQKYGAA